MSAVRPQRPLPNDVISVVTCTGQLSWYPDPEDLECVEQCGEVGSVLILENQLVVISLKELDSLLYYFDVPEFCWRRILRCDQQQGTL